MIDNISALRGQKNDNGFSPTPLGVPQTGGGYVPNAHFNNFKKVNHDINIDVPSTIEMNQRAKKDSSINVAALVQPSNEKLHIHLSDEEAEVIDDLNSAVTKQLIKQFYEAYSQPVGMKDIEYRLGAVTNVVPSVHNVLPAGSGKTVADDQTASWRVGINYESDIFTGLYARDGYSPINYRYTSYAFPPFVPKGLNYVNRRATAGDVNYYYKEENKDFDIYNLLYRKNTATVRGLSFKGINDNINTLQFLFNKALGIESTYINEWDLSIYIQEGLVRQTKVQVGNETLILPEFVTTLTFGLLRDCPIPENEKNSNPQSADLDTITPWASFNCAVSTRSAIDDMVLSGAANELNYEIRKYPMSAFWRPHDSGNNLQYYTYYVKVDDWDENGNPVKVDQLRYSNMNVSEYIDNLFAYRDTGLIYTPQDWRVKNSHMKYTPERLHGSAYLSTSRVPFEYVLQNADDRDAVLSGWNATNAEGDPNRIGQNNDCVKNNAYAYLPFWKQFFFSAEDGLGELDRYWQELLASGKQENSILDVADDIIGIATEGNEPFRKYKERQYESFVMAGYNSSDPNANPFVSKYQEAEEYGNIKIKVFKWTVEIPKTKLLNMFFNRNKVTNKAMDSSKSVDGPLDLPEVNTAVGAAKKRKQPTTTNPNDTGNNDTETYEMDDSEELGASITYADGVNNHSPFLYGGPHGKYYSPNTVEGYCQFQNEVLETVPTMDASWAYNYRYAGKDKPSIPVLNTKNFKAGNYCDSKILLGLSERNAAYNLIQKDADPEITIPYSGTYSGQYLTTSSAAWEPEICIGIWKWKKCWRLWIPKRYIFLEARFRNYWPILSVYGKWNCQYWSNRGFTNTVSISKQMKLSYILKDSQSDLIMIPCMNHERMDDTASRISQAEVTDNNRAFNNSGYYDKDGMYKLGNKGTTTNSDRALGTEVRYLIAEKNNTIYEWGRYWNCYYSGYSDYDKVKENIYKYAGASGNISKPFTVSVPIRNGRSGNVIEVVTGNARIQKAIGVTYIQELRVRWVRWRPRHWWWFGWYWWGNNRWPYYWWSRRWYWWPFNRYFMRPIYYWITKPIEMDTYSLYLYPNEVKHILPARSIIPTPNNENWRNKNSDLIVNRWGVDITQRVSNLSSYWPFTSSFRSRFGNYETVFVPGQKWYNTSFNRILHCKGILFGDIFQNYMDNGHQVIFRGGSGFRYLYDHGWVNWHEYKHLFDLGFYLFESNTTENARQSYVTYQSLYTVAASTTRVADYELTALVRDLCSFPAVLNIADAGNPVVKRYAYFNVIDVFDSFIEVAKTQIKWLEQMRQYFAKNTNDALIYNTYKDVTDPTIITINRKAAHNVRSASYYTGSYTEDINYYDALCILEQLFSNPIPGKNTIVELLDRRIYDFGYLINAAIKLRNRGCTWENLEDFSKFIANVKLYLDNAAGVREYLINMGWLPDSRRNMSYAEYQQSFGELRYDLVSNPATAIWAYLNVLYQARKFYVNKRLDKKAGSYWILRAMERVLTFRMAEDKSAMKNSLSLTSDDAIFSSSNLKVDFIQKRELAQDLVKQDPSNSTPTYTKALYIKVNYLNTDNPVDSEYYEDGLYKGKEFTLVEVAHKYAYKPKDGYYYITSAAINESIKAYVETYRSNTLKIQNLNKDFTQVLDVISKEAMDLIREEPVSLEEWNFAGGNTGEYVNGMTVASKGIIDENGNIPIRDGDSQPELTVAKNKIIDYYNDTLIEYINKLTYKVYIKWNPEGMGVGLTDTQAEREDHTFIDEYQYVLSQKKVVESLKAYEEGNAENLWYDSVFDNAGNEYGITEPIKAGITFGVVASANIDAVVSNLPSLDGATVNCLACTLANKKDYWRIEVPYDSYNIPTALLERDPILVSDVAMQELADRIKGVAGPSGESTLMGVGMKINPIMEFDSEECTVSTQAAMGLTPSLKSIGVSGMLAQDAEKAFG